MQQQDNYERQKNATSMFPNHSNSSLMATFQPHSALSLPRGTQFFVLFTSLTWLLDYISFQSTADIYWLPEILFVFFTITTAHILMWQIPTHQFVEFTESLGAEIQVVLFFIILFFLKLTWRQFCQFPTGHEEQVTPSLTICLLPGRHGWNTKAWLSTCFPSLSPPSSLTAWKDSSPLIGRQRKGLA